MKKQVQAVNFSLIKKMNMSLILDVIRQKGPISRSEIAVYTNLTPATITNITAELIDEKLIIEGESGESKGGRRPIMLRIRNDYYRVIGMYIGSKKIEIIASDLMANIKYRKEVTFERGEMSDQEGLAIIRSEVKYIVDNYNKKGKKVLGIGIGIHGLVDTKQGISIFAPNLGWKDIKLKEIIEGEFGIPVYVDNDTRTLALGESWFGTAKNISNFFCLNVEYGVGGSLVIDDRLFRGASDGAGELGHTTVDINGEECACGNRGCLETVASVKALRKMAYEGYLQKRESSIFECKEINSLSDIKAKDIFSAANNGDQFAIEIIKKVGENLGIGVANIINTFNPQLVIINGEIITTGEILLDSIRETVVKRSFNRSFRSTEIVLSKLGSLAYLKGAVVLAIQDIFANPESIHSIA